jgi:hypothetical protein
MNFAASYSRVYAARTPSERQGCKQIICAMHLRDTYPAVPPVTDLPSPLKSICRSVWLYLTWVHATWPKDPQQARPRGFAASPVNKGLVVFNRQKMPEPVHPPCKRSDSDPRWIPLNRDLFWGVIGLRKVPVAIKALPKRGRTNAVLTL